MSIKPMFPKQLGCKGSSQAIQARVFQLQSPDRGAGRWLAVAGAGFEVKPVVFFFILGGWVYKANAFNMFGGLICKTNVIVIRL